ncbi:MAG TPA: diguanylate cyclase [Herpetosiphonaceae bacterium]
MQFITPATKTILLVATSEQRRNMLTQQLEALGYSVIAIPDRRSLERVLQLTRYDLLVVDLSGNETAETHALSEHVAELLAQGIPMLTLTTDHQHTTEAWTQETLGFRVSAALRNRNSNDVLTERALRWEGLNVLDPETLLFSRRYLDAIFPIEIERSKRVHQPMSLLLIDCSVPGIPAEVWRSISTRLLTSLRRTDVIVRYDETIILVLLPITEVALARAVAIRLTKTLVTIMVNETTPLHVTTGIAAYPQHGESAETLTVAAFQALRHAAHTGGIVSFGQM